jgi:hypothetical protein
MTRIPDGEQHHRQAGGDGEQQIAGIGEGRERGLMQHPLVEHPERLAAGPPAHTDGQTDPGASLAPLGRNGGQRAAPGRENGEHEQAVIGDGFGDGIAAPLPDQNPSERNTRGNSADPHPPCSRHSATLATNCRGRNPCSKHSPEFADSLLLGILRSRSCDVR